MKLLVKSYRSGRMKQQSLRKSLYYSLFLHDKVIRGESTSIVCYEGLDSQNFT